MTTKKIVPSAGLFDRAGKVKSLRKSFPLILEGARGSDRRCQSLLGYCYIRGLGVVRNPMGAMRWWSAAARRGDVSSMFNLALMLAEGEGVPQNNRRAFKWYLRAARSEHTKAQTNVALMYLQGVGIRKQSAEGVTWLRKASGKCAPLAMFNLGVAYERGATGRKNPAAALKLYRKAAALGDGGSRKRLRELGEFPEVRHPRK